MSEMDARARDVVEKKFRVRLDSAQSSENLQAAWQVYQNAGVKLIRAITRGVHFDDAKGYAATVARNSCRDYWRVYNRSARPEALKGLESSGGGVLETPVSEVVEETQPLMRGKAFGQFYSVSLHDSRLTRAIAGHSACLARMGWRIRKKFAWSMGTPMS